MLCHNDIDDKFSFCFQYELIKMVLKMSSLQIYLSNLGGMIINVCSQGHPTGNFEKKT